MGTRKRYQAIGLNRLFQVVVILLIVFLLSSVFTINVFADHAGDALAFDGVGEYVRIGDTGVLLGGGTGWTSEKTVSLWLQPGSAAAPVTDPPSGEMIVGVDYPQIFGINRAEFNGQDRIWVWNADSNGLDMIGIPYTSGEWVHIALVHSGGVLSAYRNGELVGTKTSGATYAPANGRMYIGGSGRSGASRYFGGEIDEVQLWNMGLGSAEIHVWWDEALTASHPNWSSLTAYYQMSNGSGVVLADDTGHGHTAALLGGMGDDNWVPSDALGHSELEETPTVVAATATSTPVPPDTATPTLAMPTETPTTVVETETPTPTVLVVDTLTPTPAEPTETPTSVVDTVMPTATLTPLPPTLTPPIETATPTATLPPTLTPTATSLPPTATPGTGGADYALAFDGAGEYVRIGDTGALFGGTGWEHEKTVSLWLRPGSAAAPVTDPPSGEMIVGVDYPQIFGINRAEFNGQDRIWVWNADSNGLDMIGIPYTSGEWVHIALVHSGGVLSAYRNGELVGTKTSGATYAPANGRMYIGGSGRSGASRYFGGEIDEVQLWNMGLGSAEIHVWWDEALTASHPNWSSLTAYYQMSNGSGVVLADDTGHGHTAALLGGMGDDNWVPSDALNDSEPTPTEVAVTATPTPTVVFETETPTPTPMPETATPTTPTLTPTQTPTVDVPTITPTPVTPTATPTVGNGSGYALSFDGNNDFVELAETSSIMAAGWESTKTVSLWVRPIGIGENCAYNDVANCDSILGDRPRWWGITRGVKDGLDRIWIWNADGSMTDFIDAIGIEYTPDEWVHIALVHSDGVLRAYKNGAEVGNTLSGSTVQPYTGGLPVLHIGGVINSPSANVTFYGEIDEVKIWSIARTETQIANGMYQILTGSETGLSAYYRMSNGVGGLLSDDSVNSWDGVLFDGARGVPPDGSLPQWVSSGPF